MVRVPYTIVAKEPLMHGSDNKNSGNKRMFRREKHGLPYPKKVASQFPTAQDRRSAAVVVLLGVYKGIDKKLKSDYYGFYEQFAANILASTYKRTKEESLALLMDSCGISVLPDEDGRKVLAAFNLFSDSEYMFSMRDEMQYLMLMLRSYVKDGGAPTLFSQSVKDVASNVFVKHFEEVPFISGNAVGGIIRRLAIKDYFARIGYDKDTMGVNKSIYHELMTGGNISESTGKLDLTKKERYAHLCPPVGVLGSALGNMTTTSLIKIGSLRPVCEELGFDGAPSFWETLGTVFSTRHDTSKGEMDLHVDGAESDRNADQMIYYTEVINPGTILFSDMMMTGDDPLMVSCFWHMVQLWKDFGYVAGRSARGHARVEINIEVPKGASNLYLSHLESVKTEALSFFTKERAK